MGKAAGNDYQDKKKKKNMKQKWGKKFSGRSFWYYKGGKKIT